jgi:hypothetical protein
MKNHFFLGREIFELVRIGENIFNQRVFGKRCRCQSRSDIAASAHVEAVSAAFTA